MFCQCVTCAAARLAHSGGMSTPFAKRPMTAERLKALEWSPKPTDEETPHDPAD